MYTSIQIIYEVYVKIEIGNVYKKYNTFVGASLIDNHHLRSIMMIQRYLAHAARPS